MASADPYYNRKPVPDEFVQHVGPTGLTKQDEFLTRERKYSTPDGGDVRRFSNPKTSKGLDPHYARRQVPDEMIKGIGLTGLSAEEEHLNRERKFTANGTIPDVRRFSTSMKGGMEPLSDPYYGRKQVNSAEISGVGDTGNSAAEDYEARERKQSIFQESSDPFQQLTGTGHRQSISGVASAGAADARRRSSAVAPDVQRVNHSGYQGEKLAPIESHTENASTSANADADATPTALPAVPATATAHTSGRPLVHDDVTADPDSVAPDELR